MSGYEKLWGLFWVCVFFRFATDVSPTWVPYAAFASCVAAIAFAPQKRTL